MEVWHPRKLFSAEFPIIYLLFKWLKASTDQYKYSAWWRNQITPNFQVHRDTWGHKLQLVKLMPKLLRQNILCWAEPVIFFSWVGPVPYLELLGRDQSKKTPCILWTRGQGHHRPAWQALKMCQTVKKLTSGGFSSLTTSAITSAAPRSLEVC